MTEVLPDNVKENYLNNIPLKGLGHLKMWQMLLLSSASSDSDYVTGQVIHIDGGLVM